MDTSAINVAVLMGGMSSEHDVSLKSGQGVLGAIDRSKYTPIPITITRDGAWIFPGDARYDIYDAIPRLRDLNLGCVFIAMHGSFGEDGRIQALLDLLGLPYTGSACAASALAMDKIRSKAVVEAQGIRVAAHVGFDRTAWDSAPDNVLEAVTDGVGYPCVVKPATQGSSVGVLIPQNAGELPNAIATAFEVDNELLVEQFIEGIEVTCAVLDAEEDGLIRALPVTEIRPVSAEFFDYEAKYTPGATQEVTPAEISDTLTQKVQDAAEEVHDILGLRGWSRSDFIIDEDGPVWLEVNTVPGLTPTSLYPQACAADGISYTDMLTLFIEEARRRK